MVMIAASADSLTGLRQLLSTLPAEFPLPVAVVQPWTRHASDHLPDVLRCCARLPVKVAEEGERVLPGTIYLARPESHLLIRLDGTFVVKDGRGFRYVRSSANPLLTTAAQALGPTIAVVLRGRNPGAVNGVHSVRTAGGVVIAQEEATALNSYGSGAPVFPGSADYLLPLDRIGPALVELSLGQLSPSAA
jgi:two-component system, chemotaxis family, protein-glutamate methylesterase/glutaminase